MSNINTILTGGAVGQHRKASVPDSRLPECRARLPEHGLNKDVAEGVRLHLEVQVRLGVARDGARAPPRRPRVPRAGAEAPARECADAGAAERLAAASRGAVRHGE